MSTLHNAAEDDGFPDVDDCLRLRWTCENGGQAVDTGKSCECQCAAGYTGEHCQTGSLQVHVRE